MLISAFDLSRQLVDNKQHIVIVDCRHDLMNHTAGRQAYEVAHLPDAFFVDMETQLSTTKTGKNGRHPLPSIAETRALLAAMGVSKDSLLVVYDATGGMYALRLWWMARWAGHAKLALLDGGISVWQAGGGAVQAGPGKQIVSQPTKAADSSAAIAPSMAVVNAEVVHANIRSANRLVIDARMASRYRGENETIDPVAGHIPGAINRFFQENLQANGLFKPTEQLRAEFAKLIGNRKPEDVIHQCGSGVTACHNLFAMELAGLHGSALYPGSWSEWVADPLRPVASGGAQPRLIFICGHAGAGKTTLAKKMLPLMHAKSGESFFLLDKDTVYGAYSSKVMGLLTGNPDDRDSPTFLDQLRDEEYRGLIDIARENLALGVNVVVVGPYSREIKNGSLFDPARLGLHPDTRLTVLWIDLDETTAKQRIIERGDHRDAYKLAHWESYRQRRFSPSKAEFPKMRFLDNKGYDHESFDALVSSLIEPASASALAIK